MSQRYLSVCMLGCMLIMASSVFAEDPLRQAFLSCGDFYFATNSFESAEWYVLAVKWPSSAGQKENVLWADPDQCYSDGTSWNVSELAGERFTAPLRERGTTNLFCRGSQLYILETSKKTLVGLDVNIEISSGTGVISTRRHQDVRLDVVDGKLSAAPLCCSFEDLVAASEFRSLTRVVPVRYDGFEMTRRNHCETFATSELHSQDEAFAAKLRREVASRMGADGREIRALAVFLDADNDGDADAYIAFATDRTRGGKFRWTLWLNNGGGHSRATGPVYPVPSKSGLCELPPSVVAATNGFCRVLRFDAEPTFLVLDGKGSPTKVRDAITDVFTHRVEKLPCVEFREK